MQDLSCPDLPKVVEYYRRIQSAFAASSTIEGVFAKTVHSCATPRYCKHYFHGDCSVHSSDSMNRVEFDILFRLSVISIGRPTKQGSNFYTDCTALKCTILVGAYPLLAFLARSDKKPSCFRVAKAVSCRRVMGPRVWSRLSL